MSQENVEIVRSIYEAVNRGDWDAAFRDQRPEVELTTPPRGPNAGTYPGREECQGHGRVVRWELGYRDRGKALEAAGLSE